MKSRLPTLFRNISKIYVYSFKRFFEDDGLYRTSALTFTSILSLVPLMVVSFSLLNAFPVSDHFSSSIQNFIFEHFVPATGKVVQNYLMDFSRQISKLSAVGIMFLLFTAILMLFTIEQAFNRIWRVKTHRSGLTGFFLYWAVLTLLPLLAVLTLALSAYVFSVPLISSLLEHMGYARNLFMSILPMVIAMVTLFILYIAIPNCRVKWRHAIWGAVSAGLLLELTKHGFALYISQFDTYELLYGAFATMPIFLVWLYLVWMIVLLGAEVTHAWSSYHVLRDGIKVDGFTHAYLWLKRLYQAREHGEMLSLDALKKGDDFNYQIPPHVMFEYLQRAGLVAVSAKQQLVLTMREGLSLKELNHLLPWRLPVVVVETMELGQDDPFNQLVKLTNQFHEAQLGTPMYKLFSEEVAPRDGLEPPT